jgi:UDP-N-acetylglucosamine--N-acetylmuramyl-(pentapeptide) pyrophosphoryl-undecaprenol N-acetylglucosamine transferase
VVSSGSPSSVAVFSGGGTGGHLYPALALAEAFSALRPDFRILFLGAQQGVESRILPERGVDYFLVPVRGFRRGRIFENLSVLWALFRSLFLTGQLFSQLRPALVVVTGGYASGPAGLIAAAMGIPLALQEQNARPGFTTRVLSRWSRQVHLAFPEAREELPAPARSKALLSGNPVRPVLPLEPGTCRAGFGLAEGGRVVLVTGGSQGAQGINKAVLEAILGVQEDRLERPADVQLLWATGPGNYEEVSFQLDRVGNPGWIRAQGYIEEMPEALRISDLAISRAGAMTTSEFLAWGVPAILIPLPTSAANHQALNADSLARSGTAVHLPEAQLSGSVLWEQILVLLSDQDRLSAMRNAALKEGRPEATREIAEALVALLSGQPGVRTTLEGEAR